MDQEITHKGQAGPVSRRGLLRTLAVLGGGAFVAACGGGAAPTQPAAGEKTPPNAVKATVPPVGAAGTPATKAGAAAQPTAAAPAKSAAGTMAVWQVKLFTEAANELARKHITEFAAANNAKAEISDLPTDFIAKIIPAVEAGEVPDMVGLSTEVPQLQVTGGLADVSDVVNDLIQANGQPAKIMERAGLIEGKWYGVPWFHYADAWFIRKDVLADNNIPQGSLATFDERRDAALQVSKPDSQLWGWGLTAKSGTGDGDIIARLVLDSWGATITGEDGQKVILLEKNKEQAVEAVQWMVDTYTNQKWEKMLPPGVMGWTGGSNNENYLAGKIAMTQNASSVYWAAKNQGSPFFKETWVAPFPKGPVNNLGGGYPYYHIVFQKAKNLELAKKTAKFMSETPQVVERVKIAEGQSWPPFQKQADLEAVRDFIKSDPGYEQLWLNANDPSGWTIGWPGPLTPAAAAVANQFLQSKAMESAIAGQVKPEEAVEEMGRAAIEIYKSFGFKQ